MSCSFSKIKAAIGFISEISSLVPSLKNWYKTGDSLSISFKLFASVKIHINMYFGKAYTNDSQDLGYRFYKLLDYKVCGIEAVHLG